MNKPSCFQTIRTKIPARGVLVFMAVFFAWHTQAKELSYSAAIRKAIYFARVRNYKRALKYFKLAVQADPNSIDPYFNAGNIARHFNDCHDELLYFQGFIYLSSTEGSADSDLKSANAAVKRCKRNPKTGYLTIITETPGLDVLVNGALVGRTPLKKLALMEGDYTYEIQNPLFKPFSAQVKIQAKQTTEEHPALVKKDFYGWLQISTTPKSGVEVFLNDKAIGKTPLKKLRLKTGKYLVKLKMKGYDMWQRYVEVNKDLTTQLDARLYKPVKPQKIDMERWNKFKE